MRTLAGPNGQIHFTSLSSSSSKALGNVFAEKLTSQQASASPHQIDVLKLMKQNNIPREKVCLLDPKAPKELSPEDGEGEFDWFLFGVRSNA